MGAVIKTLAGVLMVVGAVACAICFCVGLNNYNEDKDYMEYASVYGGSYYTSLESAGNNAYAGKMMMIYSGVGVIGSIVGGLPLYWFGCLFEHVEAIRSAVEDNRRKLEILQKNAEA
ncbi:MAG: hypothetical protein E7317_00400 [Clostridiales bacterium]|nr:hypothetical protein [Clostridiales bacterium]